MGRGSFSTSAASLDTETPRRGNRPQSGSGRAGRQDGLVRRLTPPARRGEEPHVPTCATGTARLERGDCACGGGGYGLRDSCAGLRKGELADNAPWHFQLPDDGFWLRFLGLV